MFKKSVIAAFITVVIAAVTAGSVINAQTTGTNYTTPAIEVLDDKPAIEVIDDKPAIEVLDDEPPIEILDDRPAIEVVEEPVTDTYTSKKAGTAPAATVQPVVDKQTTVAPPTVSQQPVTTTVEETHQPAPAVETTYEVVYYEDDASGWIAGDTTPQPEPEPTTDLTSPTVEDEFATTIDNGDGYADDYSGGANSDAFVDDNGTIVFNAVKHCLGDAFAHNDDSINEWDTNYYVTHSSSPYGQIIANEMSIGSRVLLEGRMLAIEGLYITHVGDNSADVHNAIGDATGDYLGDRIVIIQSCISNVSGRNRVYYGPYI